MNIEIKIAADSVEELQAALEKIGKKPATHITIIPDDPRIENGGLTIPAGTDLTIAKVTRNDVLLTAAPDSQLMQMPEPEIVPEKPKRTRKAAAKPAESAQEAAREPEAPQAATTPAEPEPAAETQYEVVAEHPAAEDIAAEAGPAPTIDQIAAAGAKLLDDDPNAMDALLALLSDYSVQAITQLKPEQLGEFAAGLRALGAEV